MKIFKIVLLILLSVCCATALFFVYRWYQIEHTFRSPLPDKEGMKVIIVTPTPE